jgi:glyoxylase-like metal-dependent hydrolase (beta-lactamase superfamily II)
MNLVPFRMGRTFSRGVFWVLALGMVSCKPPSQDQQRLSSWCNHPDRAGLEKLKEVPTHRPWFRVFEVGAGVFAIDEPWQSQEVNSYLILGEDKALLFDTGMGMDTISLLVKELTNLPIMVLNSHTHPDHIGGNHEFDSVWAMSTTYTDQHAREGFSHEGMRSEIDSADFCAEKLPGFDSGHYSIMPFQIKRRVADGDTIDLGGRMLRVMSTPGHTPDAIALFDADHGYLWTGDSFYLGPIWLFMDGTDLNAYDHSIHRMDALVPSLKLVFPAHNLPSVAPIYLDSVTRAYNDIMMGKGVGEKQADGTKLYSFGAFGFKLRGDAVKEP